MTKLAKPLVGSNRRGITPAIRRAVLGDYEDKECEYCGQLGTEVDHVIPFSRGGGLDLENLAAACSICNSEKSSYTVKEWAEKRIDEGKPWPIPHLIYRVSELCYQVKRQLSKEDFEAVVASESLIEDVFGGVENLYRQIVALRDIQRLPTSKTIPRYWNELITNASSLEGLRRIWRRAYELGQLTPELKIAAKARSEQLAA